MRAINGVFLVTMILFAAVQYNDPDGPLWMAIYGVPALWSGIGTFRPALLRHPMVLSALGLTFVAALALVVFDWPAMPGWWRRDVWWEEETAREGMGAMLVAVAIFCVSVTAWMARRDRY